MKTVIKNIDDMLLKPLGEAYFQWNMQFNEEAEDIIGDLEIKPRGVAAVMQKEVRTQRLTSLLQTVANPMPDSLVNDANEAQLYAQMLQGLMANVQQGTGEAAGAADGQAGDMGGAGGVSPSPEGTDVQGSGNGTIGVGTAPTAGEGGFTGNAPQT